MKKRIFILVAMLMAAAGLVSAKEKDTTVPKEKTLKTLEGNSKTAPVVAYADITGMTIAEDGTVSCSSLVSTKFTLTTKIESESLAERISILEDGYKVTFVLTSSKPKVYEITQVSGLKTVDEYQMYKNDLAGLGKVTDAQAAEQKAKNIEAGLGEITDAQAERQCTANEKAGLGRITDVQTETQRAANKEAGLGEITDAEVIKQRLANKENGRGELTDAEADAQCAVNEAAGNGSCTDEELKSQCAANKAAGLGDINDAVVVKQREANKTAGLGYVTDAEVITQKAANKKAGYGNVTDYQLEDTLDIKKYINEKKWIHVLGAYWTLMEKNHDGTKKEYKEFKKILEAISHGNPGPDTYDDFGIHDGWVSLMNDYEEYWKENCPVNVDVTGTPAKTGLDYEKRTGNYTLGTVVIEYSKKFDVIYNAVKQGYGMAWKSDWKNLEKAWPSKADVNRIYSVTLTEDLTGKTYSLKNNSSIEVTEIDESKFKSVEEGKTKFKIIEVAGILNGESLAWKNFSVGKNINIYNVLSVEGYIENNMVKVPGKNFKILKTEVTQGLYEYVMGENPSSFTSNPEGGSCGVLPVEHVSWYDAIYFCNKLSVMKGLKPVYAVNGKTAVSSWGYTPHKDYLINGNITQNTSASGYRLPTYEEWQYAAKGGQSYEYSGSDSIDEVAWYGGNSNRKTHEVAKKKANGYGLYDMSGNVYEWVWNSSRDDCRYFYGGGWDSDGGNCGVYNRYPDDAGYRSVHIGFRIVCSLSGK